MALAYNTECGFVKDRGQKMVSGTQLCTKFLAGVQGGIDHAAQTFFGATKRLAEVG
jgi:hypothetical protein